jgi:hypothetical protein
MTTRRDTVIEVDIEPTAFVIRHLCPDVKGLAIYWSVLKNKWCVSCRCTEYEAQLIKEEYTW